MVAQALQNDCDLDGEMSEDASSPVLTALGWQFQLLLKIGDYERMKQIIPRLIQGVRGKLVPSTPLRSTNTRCRWWQAAVIW